MGDASALYIVSEGFRCSEHISGLKNPDSKRMSVFCWVFCRFSGIEEVQGKDVGLYVVVLEALFSIRRGHLADGISGHRER